jgi:glucose-6-phosphate isomerase
MRGRDSLGADRGATAASLVATAVATVAERACGVFGWEQPTAGNRTVSASINACLRLAMGCPFIMLYGRLVSHFAINPGSVAGAFDKTTARLAQLHFAEALWARDTEMWTTDVATQHKIAQRLGWLEAVEMSHEHVDRLRACADRVAADGFTDVVLLGMGGSSLAPEVLRQVIGVAPNRPRFQMLDSVDPDAVRRAMSRAKTSLFVFASKSGGTIEPNAMAAEARLQIRAAGIDNWGSRFIAITDEGTALHALAQDEGFRDIFLNPSNIGGRYSALSFFGTVPAALMGIDLDAFLRPAAHMTDLCTMPDPNTNPGLALGAIMAAAAMAGRDKLTLFVPPRLASFGLWIEQLVAESTGKHGKGIVPITGAPAGAPVGDDCLAVMVHLAGESPVAHVRDELHASGAPVVDLDVPDVLSLGAEFMRWEIATAAAGRLLDINPFDEPNVQQAKDATRVLLDAFTRSERLAIPPSDESLDEAEFTLSAAARTALGGSPATRILNLARPHDYVGLLAYLPPDDETFASLLADVRLRVAKRTGCATMVGYGPRYLHSTGQLHKGGPNTGVFVIVAAPAAEDLPVLGEPYSFGVLELAQAIGDFQSLDQTGRRALLIRLPSRDSERLRQVFDSLLQP